MINVIKKHKDAIRREVDDGKGGYLLFMSLLYPDGSPGRGHWNKTSRQQGLNHLISGQSRKNCKCRAPGPVRCSKTLAAQF